MNADQRRFDKLSYEILAAAFEVSNTLGAGFLERVYERALVKELSARGLRVTQQAPFTITYKGESVGDYLADLLVEDLILVEIKCSDHFAPEHLAQCINYLRASNLTLCLLLNFQKPKVECKRVVNRYLAESA